MKTFFKPIAQVSPNKEGIQALSPFDPVIREDLGKVADTAQGMQVSFNKDGVSNPTNTTVYTVKNPQTGLPERCVIEDDQK